MLNEFGEDVLNTYLLNADHTPRLVEPLEWAADIDDIPPVGITSIHDVEVSTVFLGVTFPSPGKADMLFETTIKGGKFSGMCIEYASYAQAENGHWILVALAGDLPCWRVIVMRWCYRMRTWTPRRFLK